MARKDRGLASASAYWRLARKAEKAGDFRQAKVYHEIGDRLYGIYLRAQARKKTTAAQLTFLTGVKH